MKIFLYLLTLSCLPFLSAAQTSLGGKVSDKDSREELIGTNIILSQNGVFVKGTSTDFDGNYKVNLDPGTYDLSASYVGYPDHKIAGVIVKAGRQNKLDFQMGGGDGISLDVVCVKNYKVPRNQISCSSTSGSITISNEELKNLRVSTGSLPCYYGQIKSQNISHAEHIQIDGIAVYNYHVSDDIDRLLGGTPANFETPAQDRIFSPGDDINVVPFIEPDPISFSEEYLKITENDFIAPIEEAFSTFSIDVDHAAYSIVRRDILAGRKPASDVARTEEMVNYFNYEYPLPDPKVSREQPFEIYTEVGECPWNEGHHLLHIGIQGEEIKWEDTPGSNLVFLIDVSGSMNNAKKLGLLKPAYKLLVKQLREQDRVAIVVYAGAAGLVLPPTPGSDKASILAAIDNLKAGGSTAGGAGINLAYKIALDHFIEGGNNRVILATDGDFNVGISDQDALKELIEEKRKEKIFLTVLGFGQGNLKDNHLETLADAGNGNYYFIDNMREAQKVFVEGITGTLFTIAKDVKIQVVFNPKNVDSYRLIGYENRLLAKEDFDNDIKDAGELGAGHTVTALYEIIPRKTKRRKHRKSIIPEDIQHPKYARNFKDEHLVTLKLRYKKPEEDESKLIEKLLDYRPLLLSNTSDNYRWSAAVAGLSLLIRDSKYKGDLNIEKVLALAQNGMGADLYGHRAEFIKLVEAYETLEMLSIK